MSRPTIELCWSAPGPQVDAARAALVRALRAARRAPCWDEWRADDPLRPRHARPGRDGPRVHVNGRLAWDAARGWDDVDALARELAALAGVTRPTRGRDPLARRVRYVMLPALALAVLPKCPFCWAAYAGVAAGFGIAPLGSLRLALVALVLALAVAVGALALRARRAPDPRPLVPAALGAAAVLAGRLVFPSQALVYAGLLGLLGAALWSAWPRPARAA